ncbi:hypothetical protein ACFUMH_05880 [Cellulomonas sp. NPDC057328]|uniref:hypothetical protein n=1 Tax=Cellulomonas sp. NPDC057328 TaxID=3346101 RepID=UPI003637D6F1
MTRPRAVARQLATVGTAVAVASVLGYVLQVAVGRSLSPADYGVFVAFWGATFGLASSLSTVEQEVARRTADRDPTSVPSTATLTVTAAVLALLLGALTLIPAVGDRIYGAPSPALAVVVLVSAAGFAVQFATRGRLIGQDRTRPFGVLVVVEAAARLVALVVAFVLVTELTPEVAAVCVGFGAFAWLALWAPAREVLRGARREHVPAAVRRAGTLMVAAALTAVLITGYPTLVTALTGEAPGAAGGAVFAALTVSRVPLLVVSPVQAVTVPAVVRWRATAADGGAAMLRAIVRRGGAALLVLAALAGAVAWFVGPWAVRLLYGPAYDVPALAVALLVGSACLLAGALLVSAALVAVEARGAMTAMWGAALAGTAVWLLASPYELVLTTAIGALVGPVLALGVGTTALVLRTGRLGADA